MASESDPGTNRRMPSLVQICQRVASAHVGGMCSLGDDVRFDLVRPILENCRGDVLDRLEQATPSLCQETSEMWKALCFRVFPLTAEQHFTMQEPDSWKEAYFTLQVFEKERLDAIAAKLRVKREEERKRKEDSQIKYTDKLPPTKRTRGSGWGQSQPKTLFQKTRSDAVKLQKGFYGARIVPSSEMIKTSRSVLSGPAVNTAKPSASSLTSPSPTPLSSSAGSTGTRVTVTAVAKNRPVGTPRASATLVSDSTCSTMKAGVRLTPNPPAKSTLGLASPSIPRPIQASQPPRIPVDVRPPAQTQLHPLKVRKDPMTSIFMPKPRTHPLVPTHSPSMRSKA